ncbi:MAG: ATP-dependent helicase [Nanoarchaeota archaeon]
MKLELNQKQKEAVEFVNGNLLIVASAGTGKTTTIISRYVNMVENHGFYQDEIMMTTFTNKAAGEMINRIKSYTNKIPKYVGTMHSIFLRFLRINSNFLGISENFIILDDDNDKKKILKEILRSSGISDKYENVFYFLDKISKFKNRGILAENLELNLNELIENKREEMIEDEIIVINSEIKSKVNFIYKKYQNYLKVNNVLDFDDVLLYTLKLLENNPEVLNYYKNKFKSIMVDEAQDLNVVQIKILEMLENNNLCLIGDDCQNIYEWRGASNELVFDFSKNKKTIYLDDNYRSKERIIKAINETIREMRFKIDKQLKCSRDVGEDINAAFFHSFNEEILYVTKKVKELIENGINENEIAVLFRANYIGNFFEKEFLRNNIPCYLSRAKGFFEREEIKDFLSFLRLKLNPNSEIDFERIVKLIEIDPEKIKSIVEYARSESINLIEALSYHGNFNIEYIKSRKLIELQELIKNMNDDPTLQFFKYFNYEKLIEKNYHYDIKRLKEKRDNIKLIKELYEPYSDELGIVRFLDNLIELGKNERNNGKVVLSTIHSAKGLEWKYVFLVCCNEGILPYYKDKLGVVKRDSELRLFYVAISRAKDKLYVSGSHTHNWQEYDPSHFLELVYMK